MPNPDISEAFRRILHTLNALSRELVSNKDKDELLRRIVAAGIALLPLKICGLWRRDACQAPDTLWLEMVQGTDRRRPFPGRLRLTGSIGSRALETCRCQVVMDLATEPTLAEKAMVSQRGLVSLLCVPVLSEGHAPDGVLQCFTGVQHAFSDLEIQVAEALAHQAGIVWRMAGMRGQAALLKEELQTRKLVDRAKEVLMDQRDLTAEEAYRWIQKRSMDTRRSMRAVAETIILSETSGHYTSIPHALDLLNRPHRK
ncbi:MAG: GAF and ANTAR domain-containing protein [Deltaproteobacteria bacterium]|nr:GAF and ANTAR domain-containing protein [Deltaproteobacteria bacterium]